MRRLLQSTSGTISVEIYDADGDLTDADGTVTATIYDSDDTEIKGASTATRDSLGVYTLALTETETAQLDRYRVVWTCEIGTKANTFTTYYEVVGGFLFGIAQLRARFTEKTEAKHSAADVRTIRESVEERFEQVTGVSFRPAGRQLRLDGDGTQTLILPDLYPREIISASIGGTALTAGEISDLIIYDAGIISRPDGSVWTAGKGNIKIHYTYGLDAPPEPIVDAALTYARALLTRSASSDRAVSQSTDVGTFRLATAGRDGPTGYPEVDAILEQFGTTRITVG